MLMDAFQHVRAKMLALAPEIAPLVIAAPAAAEVIIHDAMVEAFQELADEADAAMADDGPANDPQPAA